MTYMSFWEEAYCSWVTTKWLVGESIYCVDRHRYFTPDLSHIELGNNDLEIFRTKRRQDLNAVRPRVRRCYQNNCPVYDIHYIKPILCVISYVPKLQ